MEPGRGFRWLARVDGVANRVFTTKYNPLYHSGALAVGLLGVLLVTGVYLLIFYRPGSPYGSVAGVHGQVWLGRWIRGVHRFASDAALVAAGVHAFRVYAQRRTWGPRALAWVSGVALVGVILVTGWTGYVLVWDTHAQVLGAEFARLLDVVPIFSEPVSRAFTGESTPPSGFFFVTLFAHIALPLSMAVLLWVHVARVSRPVLLPARRVLWGGIAALTVAALLWPVPLAPEADLLRLPTAVPLDWWFSFWLPVTTVLSPGWVWLLGFAALGLACAVPWLTRPRVESLPAPAVVEERLCTGCEQCVLDCPYDAIEMVPRSESMHNRLTARVKTDLCTSCGVCIGSCPPMAISAAGVSGRDQIADVRRFLAAERPSAGDVVIVGCSWSAASAEAARSGAKYFSVPCIGTMHSSTVEQLLRGGAGGVLVVACPAHDGRTREGVTWTQQRLFHGRKADLKARVDRSRLRLVEVNLQDGVRLHAAVLAFQQQIDALAVAPQEEAAPDILALCAARQQHETVETA